MSDLKNLQSELSNTYANSLGVSTKITSGYPPFYGIQWGFLVPFISIEEDEVFLGGFIDYTSTGGRIHYGDYSGEYLFDQIATAWSLGGTVEYHRPFVDHFSLNYGCSLRLTKSELRNSFLLRVWNISQQEEFTFGSYSFGVEPSVNPSVNFYGLIAGVSLSYLIFLPTSLEYEKISDAYLVNQKGDKVSIDWGGFKFGILASFSF